MARILLADALPLLALLLASPGAEAFVRATSPPPNSKPLFWRAVSVPYVIDGAVSEDAPLDAAQSAVRRSFQHWEVACSYLRFRDAGTVSGARVEYRSGGPNQNAVLWLESNWIGSSSATAYTTLTYVATTGEILDADISMNGQNYQFSAEAGGVRDRIDVEAVVTHEVGHILGLDHSAVPGATMGAMIGQGDTFQRDLSQDDESGVCSIYPLGSEPRDPTPKSGGCVQAPGSPAVPVGIVCLLGVLWLLRRRPRASGRGGP